MVRDHDILGCADHDIKLDCLIEKGPNASLEEVMAFVESTESGKLSLQQLNGGSDAAAPVSSFRKQQRGMFKQQIPTTALLTPTCTHCGQVGHGSSRDERSDDSSAYCQTCTKCGKHGHVVAGCTQQSTSDIRQGQRRSRMSPQKENATALFQSLCSMENAHSIDDNEIICNLRDFELEHCIYDPSYDTWVKKSSAPQTTFGLYATHYPCDTRALGLQTPFRRPTKAALVSVVADTGCQSCLPGTNLLFKLELNVRHLSKILLQMIAANRNNLDIIGANSLRLSDSASQGA